MKRRRHFLGRDDSHLVRQAGVQRAPEDIGGDDAAQGKAGHLAERVDAGIGSPRARNGHLGFVELPERLFDQPLNGRSD